MDKLLGKAFDKNEETSYILFKIKFNFPDTPTSKTNFSIQTQPNQNLFKQGFILSQEYKFLCSIFQKKMRKIYSYFMVKVAQR